MFHIASCQLIKDTRQLQDLIKDQDRKVDVYPLLLTVTGYPKCGKTVSLTKSLDLNHYQDSRHKQESIFCHHEFVASGFKKSKKIRSANIAQDTSFKFGMHSGLLNSFKSLSFSNTLENNSTFQDATLKNCAVGVIEYVREQQSKINKDQTRISPDRFNRQQNTVSLEASLQHGVGFTNIWDLSINKSIRPFLEMVGCCLSRNQMWLFIDLERDVPEFHLPVEDEDDDSHKLQWRPRIQYLLRMCQMCKNTISKDGFKQFCTIFAVHRPTSSLSDIA